MSKKKELKRIIKNVKADCKDTLEGNYKFCNSGSTYDEGLKIQAGITLDIIKDAL